MQCSPVAATVGSIPSCPSVECAQLSSRQRTRSASRADHVLTERMRQPRLVLETLV